MRYSLRYLLVLYLFVQACQNKPNEEVAKNTLATQIKELNDIKPNPGNIDSLMTVWHELDRKAIEGKDTVQSTDIKYNLARLYAIKKSDSAQYYVEQALELIEPTNGNLKQKALIYNGMGNIWAEKAKEHQANYYYNKAAAIVLSDSTVPLSLDARGIMLLSAAQSNRILFQFDLARKMHEAAIPITDSLPEGHLYKQRVLVQSIQMMALDNTPADTMKAYLDKLEVLHHEQPMSYDISFYYECKAKYFDRIKQFDSLYYYQEKKNQLDEERFQFSTINSVSVNTMFISYVNVAATLITLKQPAKAWEAFIKAGRIMKEHEDLIDTNNQILYQRNLASLYQLEGNNELAFTMMNGIYQLQREFYQSKNNQAVAEMNALYQLQAKERSIRTLNDQVAINKLQLQKNKLLLTITVLTVVLLVGGICFLYYFFQQRKARQEKEKILLQQQLLRTQMEPHFIFNTLAAVQSFVRLDRKDIAIKYLNRFSRLLRSSLELSREKEVPLDEEIEALDNYLSLQQMRFEDAFAYELNIPDEQDLGAIMIPPMLIQPYVENAVLHGVDFNERTGRVVINMKLQDDVLEVTITDTGKLQEHKVNTHRSLSGAISQERIMLLGKKAKITSGPTEGGLGTKIVLLIPVVYA
ncbi:sensor histidine kinase [Sphingobacterium yanglingense]|uniref:Histidine kinase n=1 Tax=Sphingobacterium yanglingense TaxID=1437280 RepID=A0A4R6WKY1_9SPHI|nr:histidine kinase [Sphingobacterium yanglingense]TDQ79617.1 histidine kinase [Sphingobacterium yanglingense]